MLKILIVGRGSLSTDTYTPSRSVYCRLNEPFSYLQDNALLPFELDVVQCSEQVNEQSIKQYRTVIFCKHNTEDSVRVSRLAKKNGIRIIYDIDDLIHRFTEDSAAFVHMENVKYFKEHIEMADLVVAENETLKSILIQDFSLQEATVIHTGINMEKYSKKSYAPSKSNVLFTNGDNIKLVNFRQQFANVFNKFLAQYPDIEFQVFGDSEAYLTEFVRYDFLGSLPWGEHKQWLANQQVEFAIMPLGAEEENEENQLFSNCKTPIKFIEYGALRIPGVYSNTSIYRNVVNHRETGMLVENSTQAWHEALNEIHCNAALRQKISENAYEAVRAHHHIKKSAMQWREIV